MKTLAYTKDGRLTYCTAPPEQRGHGRCNHIFHQKDGETPKEFTKRAEELSKCYSKNVEDRIAVAIATNRNEVFDILVNDKNSLVRKSVAEHGRDKDLDILVHDPNDDVRMAVVKRGRDKDLDVLVHDEHEWVRSAVARYGRDKDLDVLVKDKDYGVRAIVADYKRPQDLDRLVKDKTIYVRSEVAKYGRDKDRRILINDKNEGVRRIAVAGLGLDQRLTTMNGRAEMVVDGKCIDIIRSGPKDKEVKLALIEAGYDLDKFSNDKDSEVSNAAIRKQIGG